MSRRPLVAANWKMNGTRQRTTELITGLLAKTADLNGVDVVVCPPSVYLDQAQGLLKSSRLDLGAQNVSANADGAYTGEISLSMLKDVGCRYVIVGHSERRTLLGETDEQVAHKCRAAVQVGVTPIVCVGETQQERLADQTHIVVGRQVQAVLDVVNHQDLVKLVWAYEPVWAIGTGQTATAEQAQAVHAQLRHWLLAANPACCQTRILYGGSVKASNAASLFAMPDIDGGLIGGASLLVEEFAAICWAAR